jgi:phage-related tail fiber protein
VAEQQSKGFMHKISKRALAPLAQAVVTAGTAYLTKKALEVWQDSIQPKIDERGGARSVAKETVEAAKETAKESVETVAEKAGVTSTSSSNRETERKQREKRRTQRRDALEKSGSS